MAPPRKEDIARNNYFGERDEVDTLEGNAKISDELLERQ